VLTFEIQRLAIIKLETRLNITFMVVQVLIFLICVFVVVCCVCLIDNIVRPVYGIKSNSL
jgi:hypothetical protein